MRLLYFVQYFPPEKASGLYLVEDLIHGFVEQGWEVDVYTATPTRGVSDDIRKLYSKRKVETLCDGKLRIHRMRLYREGTGFVQRTIRYTIFSLMCFYKGLTEKADAFFTGNGPPTQSIIGGWLKKLTKKKFIFNPQDLFPDSLIHSGIIKKGSVLEKIGRKVERFGYKNADAIITISNDMRNSILEKGTAADKVHVIPNWADIDAITPIERSENPLFDELNLPREKFYAVYAGNIGYVQGIDAVVEAAKLLQSNEQIYFVIFGNGSEEQKVRMLIEEYGLKNISMYPLQDTQRVSEVYSLGDVSMVLCKPGMGTAGMPSKTWSIMAAGRPVLGYFDKPSEFSKIIESSKTGWCVETGKVDEFCETIKILYINRNQCVEYGYNARKYSKQYLSKEKAIERYAIVIDNQISDVHRR